MITATYITPGTGDERKVEILKSDKKSGTAVVSPADWRGSGYFWDNKPEWFVERQSLVDVQIKCENCGTMHDPAWTCPQCGWDWRVDGMTDEQDGASTQDELQNLYRGG